MNSLSELYDYLVSIDADEDALIFINELNERTAVNFSDDEVAERIYELMPDDSVYTLEDIALYLSWPYSMFRLYQIISTRPEKFKRVNWHSTNLWLRIPKNM